MWRVIVGMIERDDWSEDGLGHGALQGFDAFAGDARYFEERESAIGGQLFKRRDALRILGDIDLGGGYDHGLLG